MRKILSPGLEAIRQEMDQEQRLRLVKAQGAQEDIRELCQEAKKRLVSVSRAIQQMAQPDAWDYRLPEMEFFRSLAKLRGEAFDPNRIQVPWALFSRDLTGGIAGQGGYLIAVATTAAVDILRPWSVVLRGGITVEENLTGDVVIPKTTVKSIVTWQTTEATEISDSTPTVQQVAMTPKVALGIVNLSRQFQKQTDADRFIRRELLRTAGEIVDTAVLNGSGASGQPVGILNTNNVSTQSGTSLAWTGCLAMKKNAAEKDAQDGTISFISTPAVRELLEGRVKESGGGRYIWEDDRIAGAPAFATTTMPAASMLSGPMAGVTLGLWGTGLQVEVNPFADFQAGIISVRIVLAVDVAVTIDPAAFTVASTIT